MAKKTTLEELKDTKKALEDENTKLEKIRGLAEDNITCFEKIEKYDTILQKLNATDGAQKDIDDAINFLNDSYSSYKNNLKGNAAKTKESSYSDVKDKLIDMKNNLLSSAWGSASAGKAGLKSRIKDNNAQITENDSKMGTPR